VWIILAMLASVAITVATGASIVEAILIGIALGVLGGLLQASRD
jgi:hypothetical protein